MNPARFFLSFLIFVFSLLIFSSPAFAQAQEPKQDLHTYTQTVMIEVASSLTCMLAGVDSINPNQKCLGISNGKIGPIDSTGGAIGGMGSLIAMTFVPPASTSDYIGYLASNFGVAKPTYAQEAGIGFRGLSPLTNVWVVFRNMTYLLFVLIFLVIGFAIMLRVRIDPRTVMSIENQIPKIVIGLILVTFSFAIVGFLIDLMWVFLYLAVNVFQSIPGFDPTGKLAQATQNVHGENALGAFNNFVGFQEVVTGSSGGIKDLVQSFFSVSASLKEDTGGTTDIIILTGLANILSLVSDTIRNALGALLGWIAGTLAFLIIGIAILYSLFRLWFQLIKAYVMILIVAVFSPFWILAGMVPGSRLTFVNLLRELGSNLITFPATLVMFLLAKTFIDVFSGQNASQIFVPPFIGNPGGEAGLKAIGALTGLGMILLMPDVNKMMRRALQAPDFDFSAIGKAVGVGAGFPTTAFNRTGQIGYSLSGIQTLRQFLPGPLGRRTSGGAPPPGGGHGP